MPVIGSRFFGALGPWSFYLLRKVTLLGKLTLIVHGYGLLSTLQARNSSFAKHDTLFKKARISIKQRLKKHV
jgi:hypothetical protein